MAVLEREKIFECEVKRRRKRTGTAGYEAFWKVKTVQEALEDSDTEFRCKDCHGAVKLFKRKATTGQVSHVEHIHKQDAEYCSASMFFRDAKDGREARLSEMPVQ